MEDPWLWYLGKRRPHNVDDAPEYQDITHDKREPTAHTNPPGIEGHHLGRDTPMSDARGIHYQVCTNALNAIGLLQERLAMATEAAEVARGQAMNAVGSSGQESGTNSVAYLARVHELIMDAYRGAEIASAEMERYRSGF